MQELEKCPSEFYAEEDSLTYRCIRGMGHSGEHLAGYWQWHDPVSPAVIDTECQISPSERAKARASFVREFETQYGTWLEVAKVCVEMDRDQDYKILGYHSMGDYLVHEAPKSRSWIYLAMAHYRELSPEIPESELAQIPIGSASILRQLSPAVRNQSKIRQAAKQKPSEFRKVLAQTESGQHVDAIVLVRLRFQESAYRAITDKYNRFKEMEPDLSLEQFLENAVAEFQ